MPRHAAPHSPVARILKGYQDRTEHKFLNCLETIFLFIYHTPIYKNELYNQYQNIIYYENSNIFNKDISEYLTRLE